MAIELMDIEYCPGGVINEYYYDDEQDVIIVNTISDVTALLERNKMARNGGSNGFSKSKVFRRIASIDDATKHRLLVEHHIDADNKNDDERLFKWLRDRDNRAFTTVDGKF